MSKLLIAGGVVAALWAVGSISGGGDSGGHQYGAEDNCKNWVKDELKAPSTADFSNLKTSGGDSGPWIITGDVDAQNGFGAQIRTGWICNVRLDSDDYFRGDASLLDLG